MGDTVGVCGVRGSGGADTRGTDGGASLQGDGIGFVGGVCGTMRKRRGTEGGGVTAPRDSATSTGETALLSSSTASKSMRLGRRGEEEDMGMRGTGAVEPTAVELASVRPVSTGGLATRDAVGSMTAAAAAATAAPAAVARDLGTEVERWWDLRGLCVPALDEAAAAAADPPGYDRPAPGVFDAPGFAADVSSSFCAQQ